MYTKLGANNRNNYYKRLSMMYYIVYTRFACGVVCPFLRFLSPGFFRLSVSRKFHDNLTTNQAASVRVRETHRGLEWFLGPKNISVKFCDNPIWL